MSALEVGCLVAVGPAYQMAERPPYSGRGTFKADTYTGRTMRVVELTPARGLLPAGAELAPTEVEGADSDAWMCTRRLTRLPEPARE